MPRTLADELDALPSDLAELLARHRFDRERFLRLAERAAAASTVSNRVRGRVTPPEPGDVPDVPEPGSPEASRLERIGLGALARGEIALVVMAGGMATRMGGQVKALVEALPGSTFLDLRLAEVRALARRAGRAPPLWIMTSHATDVAIRAALGARAGGSEVGVFAQHLSVRLTPDGRLFRDSEGRPSEHAPGHGDLPDALRESGLLHRFVARGGRLVMVANLDNLGATLDPVLAGLALESPEPVVCELVDKVGADRGGIPARLDGRPVVLEEFRLPEGFDASAVRVFNTNTFHFAAAALMNLEMDWTFFTVEKSVEGRPALQLERLIGEVTSRLPARFVRVPRSGSESRFLPVKDWAELESRRGEIAAAARARGLLD